MKIYSILLESDRMAMIRQAAERRAQEQEEKFRNIADSIDPDLIGVLNYIIRRKGQKKHVDGATVEAIERLANYGLLTPTGGLTPLSVPFSQWWEENPTREMQFRQDRAQADEYLARGGAKKRERPDWAYANPLEIAARNVIRSLTDEEKLIINKLARKTFNKRVTGLAQKWFTGNEFEFLRDKGLIDEDKELTSLGSLVVSKYSLDKTKGGMGRLSRKGRFPRR